MALSAVLLQEVVPDDVRGRVMSLYLMSAGGIMAVMNLAFGTLADRTGRPDAVHVARRGVRGDYVRQPDHAAARRIYRTGKAAG